MAKRKSSSNGDSAKVSIPLTDSVVSNVGYQQAVYNAILSRSLLARQINTDPRRNIADECGYPQTTDISIEIYRELYDRDPIANRVVEVMPKESWQSQPSVYEDEDSDTTTPFEEGWNDLSSQLRGNSKFQDEEGSPVWEFLKRADILCGIGSFGLLLLGVDDGKELREPLEVREGQKLLFLRVFDESLVEITSYEQDTASSRYGQPTMYLVTFNDPDQHTTAGVSISLTTQPVHYTRVLHIADNLGSSELFGRPRIRPVLNRLIDLQKLYGGSAEMYWKGALPGVSIETHPQLGGDVQIDVEAMRNQMENYFNGLQRYLSLVGQSANSLAPQVVDPSPQIDAQLDAICVQLEIPKRVFMGSERGELASTQDAGAWNDRLRFRQRDFVTPRIIVPFVDKVIEYGILPEPEGYSVSWPNLDALSEQEKTTIAVGKTEAITKYVGGNGESLIVPIDYLTRILGMDKEEAEAIVEAAAEVAEEKELEEELQREEQMAALEEAQPGVVAGMPPNMEPNVPPNMQPKMPPRPLPSAKDALKQLQKSAL